MTNYSSVFHRNSINLTLFKYGIVIRFIISEKIQNNVVFIAYIFVVIWLTLLGNREYGERRAMLIPFWEIANIIKGNERYFYIGQVMGNLALFMPLKYVNWKKVLLMSLCFFVGIEPTQFITV